MNRARALQIGLCLIALGLSACGVGGLSPTGVRGLHGALVGPVEELDLSTPEERASLYEVARMQSEEQGREQRADDPSLVVAEHDGHLLPAMLPPARELLAGGSAAIDLEQSSDPWPTDARPGLGGRSEKLLASKAAQAIALSLGLPDGHPLVVERAAGAPWAAAYVEGRIRLNPALLYLAAAAEEHPLPAFVRPVLPQTASPRASPAAPATASCSTAGGALLPWLAFAAAGLFRRRR